MKHLMNMNESKERRKKELLDEIKRKQEELERLETGKRTGVIPLEEYTDEDKIKYFDQIYKSSLKVLEEQEEDWREDNDYDHWAFEESMEILNIKNPKEFWNYYNSLCK